MRYLKFIIIITALLFFSNCEKDAEVQPKEYPYVITKPPTVNSNGAEFSADLTNIGNQKILKYGFVWSTESNPTIQDYNKLFDDKANNGIYTCSVNSGLAEGQTYYVRAYILTEQYEVYGNVKSFNSQGSLPPVIDDFEPKFGPIGTTVTIEGKNFALSKNENTVRFGDIEVIVDSVSENSIIITIPQITKPEMVQISIETAGMVVTSQDSFDLWFPWLRKKDFGSINNNSVSFTIGNTGYVINSNSTTMFTYNPIEDKWQNNINLPQNSGGLPLAINIDEMAYVLFDNDLWVYNKSENNWRQKKSFPDIREYDNRYTFIINTGNSFGIGTLEYPKYFWVYNIITDEWEQRDNFPGDLGRNPWGVFTCSIRGKSYLGMKADYSEQFWEYNIENSTWNLLGDLPYGIAHSEWGYFIIENELYLGLGNSFEWSEGYVSNKLWKYEINNNRWIEYRDCPINFAVKASFSINNKGYLITSYTRYYDNLDNIWEFDPSKN